MKYWRYNNIAIPAPMQFKAGQAELLYVCAIVCRKRCTISVIHSKCQAIAKRIVHVRLHTKIESVKSAGKIERSILLLESALLVVH